MIYKQLHTQILCSILWIVRIISISVCVCVYVYDHVNVYVH